MVTEIRLYVEGGGDRSDGRALIREGFGDFLDSARRLARRRRIRWSVTACGGRNAAFDAFKDALESHPEAFIVLLVDSESPVTGNPWEHLRTRDQWDPPGVPDEHCHLMVQMVEAWLVADPDVLAKYYGQGFHRNSLPRRDDVEAIPKDQLLQSLGRATADTKKKGYAKIRHCADLLGLLNQDRVRQRAHHCDLLFKTLEARLRE